MIILKMFVKLEVRKYKNHLKKKEVAKQCFGCL